MADQESPPIPEELAEEFAAWRYEVSEPPLEWVVRWLNERGYRVTHDGHIPSEEVEAWIAEGELRG